MNLIVIPYDCDNYYFRPDTTMVHTARDFYCPDEITVLEAAPCLCVRICKTGKAISERFSGRYYDAVGFGVTLYAGNILAQDELFSLTRSTSFDATTVIPTPLAPAEQLQELCPDITREHIGKWMAKISRNNLLRIGDMLIFELAPRSVVDKSQPFTLEWGDKELFSFNIC